ncbi:hypothetical protein EYF80_043316 [Liparis tanakae]|uniref:Uncharacterized protein n=1 Tax=Liparis tanakae TaxID=230148 RepID=A0A4Z2FYX0_9TELE|nr:hypothetical protein EYF80_043316 [Liparis tanakae]
MSVKKPWTSSSEPRKATRTASSTASTFSRTSRFLERNGEASARECSQQFLGRRLNFPNVSGLLLPVKQRQQGEPVKVQADPQEGQKPQAVVLPGFAGGGRCRGVLWPQRRILELGAQVPVLLLQQLRVHRQQTVQTDLREGDLSHGSKLTRDTSQPPTSYKEGVSFPGKQQQQQQQQNREAKCVLPFLASREALALSMVTWDGVLEG